MRLTIANKLYSSWSLRPWILMRMLEIPFEETVIPLRQVDTTPRILARSPSGKVPALEDREFRVWESLAIIEHLDERFPDRGVWPADPAARAHARSAANEMHAGFQALRMSCPMNLGKRFVPRERGPEVAADVARIIALWREAREHFGARTGLPFLYGAFSAADAMFAPVVTRLDTYQIAVDASTRAYMDAVLGTRAYKEWREAALAEPWLLPELEQGETVAEVLYHSPS